MKTWKVPGILLVSAVVLIAAFLTPLKAFGHCDGLDGPVVTAARAALETGKVEPVLIWVQNRDEDEIKKAFQKTLAVRKLNPEARELADYYFFETLVRLHRAGEGEPYTGLKPAGRDLGPAIPAADKSIVDGKLEPVHRLLSDRIHDGLHEKFKKVMDRKDFKKDDLAAGRAYVEAYVVYIHYVEELFDRATKAVHGHYPEHGEATGHKH